MQTRKNVLVVERQPADWRKWLLSPIIPKGEHGDSMPLSVAYPRSMVRELDRIAKQTRNSRADTIRHLLRWAIEAYDKSRAEEESSDKRAG